jgi:hypothetical protein
MKRGSRQLSVTGYMSHYSCPCGKTENVTPKQPHGVLKIEARRIGGHVTSPQQCDQTRLSGEGCRWCASGVNCFSPSAALMEASASKNSLLGLHQDLLVKVLLQFEPRDLQSVSCSCKALALTDSPLWQSLFFHKWDVPRGSHLNYKKLYFRREQVLRYLESVCNRLKPEEEPSLQTLHDGRRVVGAGRFAILCPSKLISSSLSSCGDFDLLVIAGLNVHSRAQDWWKLF